MMYKDIISLLDEHRLKEAFELLDRMAEKAECWKLREEIDSKRTSYNYMLQYASQGIEDPERTKLYRSIRNDLYSFADSLEFQLTAKTASGDFAERYRRMHQGEPFSIAEAKKVLKAFESKVNHLRFTIPEPERMNREIKEAYELRYEKLDEMFDWTWTSPLWSASEASEVEDLLWSTDVVVSDVCVVVCAMNLSLMRLFDFRKFMILVRLCRTHFSAHVSLQALVGIVLAVHFNKHRVQLYPELSDIFSLLGGGEELAKNTFYLQRLFLLSRETEKIEKNLKENIIPQMMKECGPQIKDLADMEEMVEKNPEWELKMEELKGSLSELEKMQKEGADTNMSTFSQLKNFPFFYHPAHWFYIFDWKWLEAEGLFVNQSAGGMAFIKRLVAPSSHAFCNSDKYSLCFTMHNFPSQNLEAMSGLLNGSDEDKDYLNDYSEEEWESLTSFDVLREYVHDLYRFCKLWKSRGDVKDVFKESILFWENSPLKSMIGDEKQMYDIAEFLFSKNYLDEALDIYVTLVGKEENHQADIWQKMGYIYQKQKRYDEALDAYQKAMIIQPEDNWTWKELAQCYRRKGDYTSALKYYRMLEEKNPENLLYTSNIGQCYVNMQAFDEALPYFYKVEYLGKSPEKAWRAIAWCLFMTGKLKDSETFYLKLMQSYKAQLVDWLNFGHLLFVQNRIAEALENYRKVEKESGSHQEFVKLFMADAEVLRKKGLCDENIYMLPEML